MALAGVDCRRHLPLSALCLQPSITSPAPRCHFIHPEDGIETSDTSHLRLLQDRKFTAKLDRGSGFRQFLSMMLTWFGCCCFSMRFWPDLTTADQTLAQMSRFVFVELTDLFVLLSPQT